MIFMNRDCNNLDFYLIFENSGNNLEKMKIGEEKWKVRLMEGEFKKRILEMER
jgi:hypothetical protein